MSDSPPQEVLWGHTTDLAIENFPISGQRVPPALVMALAAIKAEAARTNGSLGAIDPGKAESIAAAADLIAQAPPMAQFPVDVYQTGSGTSTNMNVNEVIATLASRAAGTRVHPNDDVNASQSSNDVFPSAIRIAVLQICNRELLPAVSALRASLAGLSDAHATTVKLGRTHLMDAVPMTFGQEAGAWARSVAAAHQTVTEALVGLAQLPLGGTAVGTGLNAPAGFGKEVARRLSERFALPLHEASDHVHAQSTVDAFLVISAALRNLALALHKISGDLRLLASGPWGGLGEVVLPELQPGSSIMPGKVNPVIPEAVQQVCARAVGNDATVVFAATLSTLQLNTGMPVIAVSLVESAQLLSNAARCLAEKCIDGIQVDVGRMRQLASRSPAMVTALAAKLGYDRAAQLARMMVDEGLSLTAVLAREEPGIEAPDVVDVAHGGQEISSPDPGP